MDEKPKYKIKKKPLDYCISYLTFGLMIVCWMYFFFIYSSLSQRVPIHYNLLGEPDNYGDKNSIIGLLIAHTFLVIMIALLNRVPHTFNYPHPITRENYQQHYYLATQFLRFINFGISIVFASLFLQTIAHGLDLETLKNLPILFILILVMLFPTVWYFYKARRIH